MNKFKIKTPVGEYDSFNAAIADMPNPLTHNFYVETVRVCERCGGTEFKVYPKYDSCMSCHKCTWRKPLAKILEENAVERPATTAGCHGKEDNE